MLHNKIWPVVDFNAILPDPISQMPLAFKSRWSAKSAYTVECDKFVDYSYETETETMVV